MEINPNAHLCFNSETLINLVDNIKEIILLMDDSIMLSATNDNQDANNSFRYSDKLEHSLVSNGND